MLGVSFFFSSRRRHTRSLCDWSSDVCSSDLESISSGVTRGTSVSGVSRPSTRKYGWFPTFRCKSEDLFSTRSEERRVGKECRWRCWPCCKQKNKRQNYSDDGYQTYRLDAGAE